MSLSKLKQLHIIIIGAVLCILAGVAIHYLLIKPSLEAYNVALARYEAARVVGNLENKALALQALELAKVEVAKAKIQQKDLYRKYMPVLSFGRRDVGMLALWNEQIKHLGPYLTAFAKHTSAKVLSAEFTLPAPPANPNDAVFDADQIVLSPGSVSVQGDFKSLMRDVKHWNNCKRLIMVSPVSLSGTSPNLVSSYSITCYIFPLSKGGPQIPLAGVTAAAGGAAGMPGAGMPGMPGAGMPGMMAPGMGAPGMAGPGMAGPGMPGAPPRR